MGGIAYGYGCGYDGFGGNGYFPGNGGGAGRGDETGGIGGSGSMLIEYTIDPAASVLILQIQHLLPRQQTLLFLQLG